MSLLQNFFVLVPKLAVSLQPASLISSLLFSPLQHLASLQVVIILTLKMFALENGSHFHNLAIHFIRGW
jgi:hypothetical protein